jgi:surfeit locus 1 family protein
LLIVGVATFVRLGQWQLSRAEEKRALIAQFVAGETTTPPPIENAEIGKQARYQSIELHGSYDSAHQVLLDNMPSRTGQAGYRVLTPFQYAPNAWIFVDRGWVAPGATRAELPHVEVSESPRRLVGRLDELPRPGMRLGDVAPLNTSDPWPRVLNFPEYAQLQPLLARPLDERIVLLDRAQPEGYERAWEMHFDMPPERHLAYAVQWFAFAAAAVVIYLVLSLKPIRVSNEQR